MKSLKRRGQAFIVFDRKESAEKAKAAMLGFPSEGRPLVCWCCCFCCCCCCLY